jgi:hypothetical protein
MTTAKLGAVVVALAIGGCGAGRIGEDPAPPRATWMLHADADLALVDPRCAGAECPRYPNPVECDALEVKVFEDGRVCGVCNKGGIVESRCGGPARGIPYRCFVELAASGASGACLVCDDIFGTAVMRDCGGGRTATVGYSLAGEREEDGEEFHEPPAPPADETDRGGGDGACYDARRADGTPCSLCVDAEHAVVFEDCTTPPADDGGGSTPPGEPPDDGGSGMCPPDAFAYGQQLFADALNAILREAGMPADYVPGADAETVREAREDALRVRAGALCAEGSEEALDEWDDEGWLREGRPRCGFMVTIAVGRACRGASSDCALVEGGIIGEQAWASDALDDRYDCVASPLVLDLDGDGVRSVRGNAVFDLAATGRARRTAWVAPGDALLAIDRDGDGAISSGRELFGEVAPGRDRRLAGDGFAALAALDLDRDGDVDADDPGFVALRAWRDDGDGRSEPGELSGMDAAGVERVYVGATPVGALDDAGSVLALWGRFERRDGSFGAACDVFFASQ